MKKKVIIAICCLVLLVGGLLVYPYNIYHHFTAEKRVEAFMDPNMQNKILGTDADITNVKYLGNDIYELQTEEKSFLVTIKSDGSSQTMNVFEHRQRVTKTEGYKDGR